MGTVYLAEFYPRVGKVSDVVQEVRVGKSRILFVLGVFAVGLLALTGCFSSSNDNPVATVTNGVTNLTPQTGNASVRFNIQLTPDGQAEAMPAIRSNGTKATVTVSFSLITIDPSNGQVSSQTQTVSSTDGTASYEFTNVRELPTIGRVAIDGGSISGWRDFHGAADLVAGPNALTLNPVNSGFKHDLVAQVLQNTINQATLLASAPANLVARCRMAVDSITPDTTQANATAGAVLDAFNTFVGQIAPTNFVRVTASSTGGLDFGNGQSISLTNLFAGLSGITAIDPTGWVIDRVVFQGLGGRAVVLFRNNANNETADIFALVRLDPTNPNNRFVHRWPGKLRAAFVMPDGSIIFGGNVLGRPVLVRWNGNAHAEIATTLINNVGVNAPAGLTWSRVFDIAGAGITSPVTVVHIGFDPMQQVLVVTLAGVFNGTPGTRIYKVNPVTGQDLANYVAAVPVFTPPPTVRITSPVGSATVTAGNPLTVQVFAQAASGTINKVVILNGPARIGEATLTSANNYSFTIPSVPAGLHFINAMAIDSTNASRLAEPVKVMALGANAQLPTIRLISPEAGKTVDFGTPVEFVADASVASPDAIRRVVFEILADPLRGGDFITAIGEIGSAPYQFVWRNMQPGDYYVRARAVTLNGGVTVTEAIKVSVLPQAMANLPPIVIGITSPAANAVLPSGQNVTIVANELASGNPAIRKVEFWANDRVIGGLAGLAPNSTYNFVWNAPADGFYQLNVRAFDQYGKMTPGRPVPVAVGNVIVPPSIMIASPTENQTIKPGDATTIVAYARANGGATITNVSFGLDQTVALGQAIAGASNSYTCQITWPANLTPGTHFITAKAIDNGGRFMITPPMPIVVAGVPGGIGTANGAFAFVRPVTNAALVVGTPIGLDITTTATTASGADFVQVFLKIGDDQFLPIGPTTPVFGLPRDPASGHFMGTGIIPVPPIPEGATQPAPLPAGPYALVAVGFDQDVLNAERKPTQVGVSTPLAVTVEMPSITGNASATAQINFQTLPRSVSVVMPAPNPLATPTIEGGVLLKGDTGDPTAVKMQFFLMPPPEVASNAPPILLNPIACVRNAADNLFTTNVINLPGARGVYGLVAVTFNSSFQPIGRSNVFPVQVPGGFEVPNGTTASIPINVGLLPINCMVASPSTPNSVIPWDAIQNGYNAVVRSNASGTRNFKVYLVKEGFRPFDVGPADDIGAAFNATALTNPAGVFEAVAVIHRLPAPMWAGPGDWLVIAFDANKRPIGRSPLVPVIVQ